MHRALLQLLQHRFGTLPDSLAARLAAIADQATLEAVFNAALDAPTLAEFEHHLL